mgnify:CR=1 FL=1
MRAARARTGGDLEPALRDDEDVAGLDVHVRGNVAAAHQVAQTDVVELAAVGGAEDARAIAVGEVGEPAHRDHHVEQRHLLAVGKHLRLRRLADDADLLVVRAGELRHDHRDDRLADVLGERLLDVAREQGASKIVDLATLTGACCVALGLDVAGVMSNDEIWQQAVLNAGKAAGEPLWPLPMFPEYNEEIAGSIADIKNVGNGRWGGAITAAKFLECFVGDTPCTYIDIAGPAFGDQQPLAGEGQQAPPSATSRNHGSTPAAAGFTCARLSNWPKGGSKSYRSSAMVPNFNEHCNQVFENHFLNRRPQRTQSKGAPCNIQNTIMQTP